ncbi:MAG: HlyD family secretion protein [Prevotella ruminicola]|uniref:HlyD family secretion protein n=1 Tax=Xylanibacter ruminicola TaxID=839 RepID=A0A9D5P449_XYLRU|nr:HlyD family secretion protein [Xylanibacter ruminicola]
MNKRKQALRAYNVVVVALMVLGFIFVCSRFVHLGSTEYTDNAMVHRHLSPVNTRVPGFIKEIRFDEFQFVHKGDTLVVIEDAEFRLALAQAEAGVKGQKSGTSAVSAGMSTTQSNVRVASAGIDEARIQMENAQKDYHRFEQLLQKEAVTRQQYDHVKAQYEAARARYEAARNRQQATHMVLGEQQQRLGQSAANESVAEAQLNLARLNLSYTVITAPCDGYIGRKDIHVGQLVQPGQLLVNVIDQNTVWVIANYRESQMHHISVGAAVEFEADAIPGVTFKGVVKSISAASGASYSNMPVDNATGNFVKVEQRVPVRIELTEDNNKTDVKRLLSGLNVECEVDY